VREDLFASRLVQVSEKYDYTDLSRDSKALEKKYPAACRVVSAGKSLEGRELWVLILGDKNAKTQIFIQASIHARESMTALLAMLQAEDLLKKGVPEDVCFHILPMANPDGVTISQQAVMKDALADIYASDIAMGYTHATAANYLPYWKANAVGVDINRNFSIGFGQGDARSIPSFALYSGQTPEDQPESSALAEYMRSHDFTAVLSYHSFGSIVYYGDGDLARCVHASTGLGLEKSEGAMGGFLEWVQSIGVPSVTLEFGSRACPLPMDELYSMYARSRDLLRDVAALYAP